ncbi:hypothetical protein ACLB2K_015519 [Fragaria x ananassa]
MTTMISEWVRAGVGKSQALLVKLLLLAPNFSSRLQPRMTSQEEEGEEEEWRCWTKNSSIYTIPSAMRLPELDLERGFYVEIATFTTPPTSPDCVIFVLCRKYQSRNQNCIISTCKLGDRRRSSYKTTCQGSVEGVTYVDGIFYCIFPEKNYLDGSSSVFLSTFNKALQEWVMDYTSIKIEDHNESRTLYLVESINGKLLLAVSDLAHDVGSHCWFLYQFDWLRKDWTMVRSLGHQVLLLSSSSSISCPTLGKDSKLSDMIFHLSWGKEPFTWSSDGVWRKALL